VSLKSKIKIYRTFVRFVITYLNKNENNHHVYSEQRKWEDASLAAFCEIEFASTRSSAKSKISWDIPSPNKGGRDQTNNLSIRTEGEFLEAYAIFNSRILTKPNIPGHLMVFRTLWKLEINITEREASTLDRTQDVKKKKFHDKMCYIL